VALDTKGSEQFFSASGRILLAGAEFFTLCPNEADRRVSFGLANGAIAQKHPIQNSVGATMFLRHAKS